jgi:hypothetical protein
MIDMRELTRSRASVVHGDAYDGPDRLTSAIVAGSNYAYARLRG